MSLYKIPSKIHTNTFSDKKFKAKVKKSMSNPKSSLENLEIASVLVRSYHMSNELFHSYLVESHRGMHMIHSRIKNFLNLYLERRSELKRGSIIPMLHHNGQSYFKIDINDYLSIKKDLVKITNSDFKKTISSIYGESLVRIFLERYPNVSCTGVLKVDSGEDSSPDFIVINKSKKLELVAEAKGSIGNNKQNTKSQIKKLQSTYSSLNIRGLGFNVYFRYKSVTDLPVIVHIRDPEMEVFGRISSSIVWKLALLDATLNNSDLIISIRKQEWVAQLLEEYHDVILSNQEISLLDFDNYFIKDNYLMFENPIIDKFMTKYFDAPEDEDYKLDEVLNSLFAHNFKKDK